MSPLLAMIPVAGIVLLGVLALLVGCAAVVHFRGKVRHKFGRQLMDHSTFAAPYNLLMYASSAVPNAPRQDLAAFPELAPLGREWQTIRDEALGLQARSAIHAADGYNDLAFNSFYKRGWKRFFLKWYDEYLPSARELCPKTVALLESMPNVHAALFATMGPNNRLPKHRDPFAGSLRYHLGLETPNDDACRIYIDGDVYSWRDGEALMFDETYIHWVRNDTDQERIILFCDVERPLKSRLMRGLNRFVIRHFVKGTATRNVAGEKVGILNHAFRGLYRLRLPAKRLRKASKPIYYTLKYVVTFGALLLALRFTGVL